MEYLAEENLMEKATMPTLKLVDDITPEERKQIVEELEEEHRLMVKEHYKEHLRLKKKYDPKYRFIDYGFRGRFLSSSKYDKITKNALVFINRFEDFFRPQCKGLFISGNTGTGKSYLASMIANEMADRGYSVYMARNNDAIDQFNDLNDLTLANMIKVRAFNLIILDDFGSSRNTEYQVERLFNLIDTIGNAEIPLIVTTNLTANSLKNEKDIKLKRIYERILERCSYFPPMIGDSKRIEEARRIMGVTMNLFEE